MPEGDSVYRAAKRLREALDNRTLTRSDFRVPRHATADLRGRAVLTTISRGKHLLTRVEGGLTVHTHLRMEGSWRVGPAGRPVPRGDVVRLVLANAVYFKDTWRTRFDGVATGPGAFHAPGGDRTVTLMHATGAFSFAVEPDYEAVALPYASGLSFVGVVPRALADFEGALDAAKLGEVVGALHGEGQISVTLPKLSGRSFDVPLRRALSSLGAEVIFSAGADLSGMSTTEELVVSDVTQKTFLALDEAGTEAAAVTVSESVAVCDCPPPPPTHVIAFDRPFVFAIRDDATGAILFLGHIENPAN